VFDLATKRKINKGFNDGFTRAVEIVVTPVLLGFLGVAVDGWLGTRPAFTLGLAIFGVCGIVAKLWLGYDREMKVEEAQVPTTSRRTRVANAAPAPVDMRLDPGIGRTTSTDGAPGTGSTA
jgi:F0F1-type ATP synthase assembly protein I